MSIFDPNAFLTSTTTEVGATRREPLPVGVYQAQIEDITARNWQSKDGSKSGYAFDVKFNIIDHDLKTALGRESIVAFAGITLDITTSGQLDMGPNKNLALNRLRDACGMNVPGKPFSPMNLKGQMCRIAITHEPAKDGSGEIYDRVTGYSKF
jgi:hypothetical protein